MRAKSVRAFRDPVADWCELLREIGWLERARPEQAGELLAWLLLGAITTQRPFPHPVNGGVDCVYQYDIPSIRNSNDPPISVLAYEVRHRVVLILLVCETSRIPSLLTKAGSAITNFCQAPGMHTHIFKITERAGGRKVPRQ